MGLDSDTDDALGWDAAHSLGKCDALYGRPRDRSLVEEERFFRAYDIGYQHGLDELNSKS